MYTVAVIAALTYPSQCLPAELLQAKINVSKMRVQSNLRRGTTFIIPGGQFSGTEIARVQLCSISRCLARSVSDIEVYLKYSQSRLSFHAFETNAIDPDRA